MNKLTVDPRAKGLIFDIDGTLLDTMPTHFEACNLACRKYGFEFPYDFFLAKAGIPSDKTFILLGEHLGITDLDMVKISREKEELYKSLAISIKPISKVANLAKTYYGKLPLTCGTGADRDIARVNIDGSGLRHLFMGVVTCEDVENPKPAPDTFLRCAEIMNLDPKDCQVFEDGEPGLQAARDAGMIATDIRIFD